jgi:hypothetical protein
MNKEMGEMHTRITPMDLAAEMQVSPERVGQLFRAFRDGKHPHFVGRFNRFAELNPIQVAVLRGEDFTVVDLVEPEPEIKESEGAAAQAAESNMSLEAGPVNESAPQKVESNAVELAALAVAFLIPTLASAFNTYNVSHQVAKDWRVAMFIMVMVMLTPALFIVARMNWVGAFVAFGVVIFEGFCNLSAIYLSLLGGMEYILDGKRGVCSDFLQSVVNLTNSDHRPTALAIGGALALLIAATQLTAFWAIRNRIK